MWPFFRRSVDLKDYLRRSKKIRINGIAFEIRKVEMEDHLAGLNVMLKLHELYKREKPSDSNQVIQDYDKIRTFLRDFLYAGIVSPKLSMKKPVEDGYIHVDELTADADLAQKLSVAIIEYSYSKKN